MLFSGCAESVAMVTKLRLMVSFNKRGGCHDDLYRIHGRDFKRSKSGLQ